MALNLIEFTSREDASEAVAASCAGALRSSIHSDGHASLMLSGGSSPVRTFERLSARPIDWSSVTVGLVDERWVAPDDPDSNERLVREHLFQGHAAAAEFVPMKTSAPMPAEAAADRSAAYAPHCDPVTFVLLGMGLDGHTASWFPGVAGLEDLFDPPDGRCVAAIEAPGATVPQRMTLTGPAIVTAQHGALLVFGEKKRAVLDAAELNDPLQCPIRFAIDGLGERLAVYWAP